MSKPSETQNTETPENLPAQDCDSNNHKENYISIGLCLGLCFGVVFGQVLFDNLTMGLSIGMCLGLLIGTIVQKQKEQ